MPMIGMYNIWLISFFLCVQFVYVRCNTTECAILPCHTELFLLSNISLNCSI